VVKQTDPPKNGVRTIKLLFFHSLGKISISDKHAYITKIRIKIRFFDKQNGFRFSGKYHSFGIFVLSK